MGEREANKIAYFTKIEVKYFEKIARRTTGAKDFYSLQNQLKPRKSKCTYLFSNEIV
jgi:hypothetical protein